MSLRHTRRGGAGGSHRGGCSQIPLSRASIRVSLAPSFLAILSFSPYKIGPACGPRVYLRCSTSRAKYYASVLLCDHPDAVAPHCVRGRRDCGFECCAECVYTLAHAIGFVTRSLYAVPGCLSKPIYSIIFEVKSEQLRMENNIFYQVFLPQFIVKKAYCDLLRVLFIYIIKHDVYMC